ncbi:hypothetical protein [Microbacterium oleivorans]|uniref:hypothetical protein n=1 Tax=Microbacterium oleivorans TaxID=273677 RepID=UPI00203D54BC|nr:hypothetical protein [Microbacterium oleivorans]MCM3695707.1 hypothetical protein [Microbacterium oleivorans]
MRHISFSEARGLILDRASLERAGWRSRDITAAVKSGRMLRVQRNRYVASEQFEQLWPEARHLVRIAAVDGEMKDGTSVFSYQSAAVLWGLPLARHEPDAVHASMPGDDRMTSRLGLRRHADRLEPSEVAVRLGVPCTTLARTLWDVCRILPPSAAVAAADAALRISQSESDDPDAGERLRQGALEIGRRKRGSRGAARAEAVIAFANPLAESTGESLARWMLAEIGFTRFALQVPVRGPGGSDYRVDIELEEESIFVEFDGTVKYRDEALRAGRNLDDILLLEKQREDWIRGVTQKRLVRIGWADLSTPDALAARLAAFHVRPRR